MLEHLISIALAQGFATDEAQEKINEFDEIVSKKISSFDINDDTVFDIDDGTVEWPKMMRARRRALTRRKKKKIERLIQLFICAKSDVRAINKVYRKGDLCGCHCFGRRRGLTRRGLERDEREDKLHMFERVISEY